MGDDTHDIEQYASRLKEHVKAMDRHITKIRGAEDDDTARRRYIKDAHKEVVSYKKTRKYMKDEMASLRDTETQNRFQTILKKQDKKFKTLNREFKELDDTATREDLLKGGARADNRIDTRNATNSELLEGALDEQGRTAAALQRTLQTVAATEEVGIATAQELVKQGQQIGRIQEKVVEMDQNLNRADKLISRFMRRMYTDKIILAFTCLIFCAIAGIIVYSTFIKPDQSTFNVPDHVKPPNPNDVHDKVTSATSRLLAASAERAGTAIVRGLRGAVTHDHTG